MKKINKIQFSTNCQRIEKTLAIELYHCNGERWSTVEDVRKRSEREELQGYSPCVTKREFKRVTGFYCGLQVELVKGLING